MARKIETGSVAVRAPRPVYPKGAGGWAIVDGRVASESPEAAASFAAELVASLAARRAGEAIRAELGTLRINRYDGDTAVGTYRLRHGAEDLYGPFVAECDWRGMASRIALPAAELAPVVSIAPTPAPVSRKPATRRSRTAAAPAPAPAPVVASSDPLAPCERCGRTDWRTAAGRAWHVANNPDCAKYRKADRHSYAAA